MYLDDEAKRKEYVLADSGLIWRGSHNRMRPCSWNFAQFEKDILECCVYLLSAVGKLTVAGRAGIVSYIYQLRIVNKENIFIDPVRVARAISAAVIN